MKYVLKRLFKTVLLLIAMTFINFCILYYAPGNPIDAMANPKSTEEVLEKRKEDLGLKKSIPRQYVSWLSAVSQGRLGRSFSKYEPVSDILGRTFGKSILLSLSGLVLGILLSFVFGLISAYKFGSFADRFFDNLSLVFMCIPTFLLGLVLIYLFALRFPVLPTGGSRTLGASASIWDTFKHLIMPASVLGTSMGARNMRFISTSLREIEKEPYILTPKARGLNRRKILVKHMMKNALMPVITNISMELPILVSGALVTEKVFNYPGMGSLMMDSVSKRDYPVIMGINLYVCIFVVVVGLTLDLLYHILDHRLERDES